MVSVHISNIWTIFGIRVNSSKERKDLNYKPSSELLEHHLFSGMAQYFMKVK